MARFRVPEMEYHFEPLTQGLINDTFLILHGDGPLYILQRINHTVFPNVEGLMGNIQNAFSHLHSTSYTEIELVPTKEGRAFLEHSEHGFWRVMTYISNSTAYDITQETGVAKEAGRIIGEFHLLLKAADPSKYVDTIPDFHNLEKRSLQFTRALKKAKNGKTDLAKEAIAFANKTLKKLSEIPVTDLPLRVCHNDTKLNNILFSKNGNKALCLIDLDTLMQGYFHYDFGDAVRTIANTAAEDEQEHSKITFNKPLFEAFIDGLALNKPFLQQTELDALVMGAILMPFLHGLRALTDFLNNNIYYKVAYENQNLDRCRSLFNFTEKVLCEEDYMRKTIIEKLAAID